MPIGLEPAGFGTPLSADAPPSGAAGVRYVNPATRDYEVNSVTGQQAQMPSVRQRVLLALMTTQESASVQPGFGVKMPRKIDGRFQAEAQQRIREALRQLTDVEKVCRIDGIAIDIGRSASATARVRQTVSFTDLTTGLQQQVSN